MKVAPQKVVAVAYQLTDMEGDVLDAADTDDPLLYLHGAGQLLPGIEAALEGREPGESVEVDISAADGYGEYSDDLRMEFDRSEFADVEDQLEEGVELEVELDDVELLVTIVELSEEKVVIDANHELAGIDLHFSGKVLDVREPTPEELEHGHAHYGDEDEECE